MQFFWKMVPPVLLLLFGYGLFTGLSWNNRISWNLKTVITVETPDGLRQGSGIVEIRGFKRRRGLTEFISPVNPLPRWLYELCGEAVVIDLGNDNYLFSLPDWRSYAGRAAVAAFWDPEASRDGNHFYMPSKIGQTTNIPKRYIPDFVRFADLSDPDSVEVVPLSDSDQSFAEGHKIVSMEYEITDAPKTTNHYENIFPWWNEDDQDVVLKKIPSPRSYSGRTVFKRGSFKTCGQQYLPFQRIHEW
ncbi:MAG: hypothetical protein GY947_13585 [Rhodobacteraceae bacterium]|nr:hypothetical protein [Paracoccaceae bacterium]